MKNHGYFMGGVSSFIFVMLMMFNMQAKADLARISYLTCGANVLGVGAVNFLYNGTGFTITEYSSFGVPFTQRGDIISTHSRDRRSIEFKIRGSLTGMIYTLSIFPSGAAKASTSEGSMNVLCAGDISKI